MSQGELALEIDVDQATISRAERMDSTAKLETYQKCAKVLGVSLSELFAEERPEMEAKLLEAFRELSEQSKTRWLELIQLASDPLGEAGTETDENLDQT